MAAGCWLWAWAWAWAWVWACSTPSKHTTTGPRKGGHGKNETCRMPPCRSGRRADGEAARPSPGEGDAEVTGAAPYEWMGGGKGIGSVEGSGMVIDSHVEHRQM